jgi:PAS domain S-box-containing protein
MAGSRERAAAVEAFHTDAQERALAFQWSLEQDARSTDAVVALFESSLEVEPQEFDAFARRVLGDHPGVEQVAWARRAGADGSRRPSSDTFVIEYEHGLVGAPLRIGTDLLADPSICARACRDRALADSLAVRWQPPGGTQDDAPRLIVLAPFYDHAMGDDSGRRRPENLRGVVAVTLRVDRIYEDALQRLRLRSMQLYLYDDGAPSDRDLVFYHPSRLPDGSNTPLAKARVIAERVQFSRHLEIGGLPLRFVVVPTGGVAAAWGSPTPWILLLCGLALTGMGTRYLIVAEETTNQLKSSLARYRAVNETSSSAIVFLDEDLRILDLNPAAEHLSGYPRARTIGRAYVERFVIESARTDVEAKLRRTLAEGEAGRYVISAHARDGKERIVSWTANRMLGSSAERLALTLVGADMTEVRATQEAKAKLEAQMAEGHKMEAIGVLAGGIAHDFNNVLAAIIGYTELAMGKVPAGAAAYRDLEQVLDAGHHASKLVKQILAFSRKGGSVSTQIDMQTVVGDALELVAASLPAMITLRRNISVDPGVVMADESEIRQVVLNLCTNAYQAIGETEGILSVSLDAVRIVSIADQQCLGLECGAYVRLTVEDTGCGIDEITKRRIFEPFFTTKPIGEGTGMGLAVVHGIVVKCGGTIRVESTEGLGSTFEVYLPTVQRAATSSDADAGEGASGERRILLVDDEARLVEMGRQMLETLGCRVTSALGSREALAVFRRDPNAFDLVITDQSMPEMSGVELANAMLEIRPSTPIVIATGYSNAVTAESARSLGFRGYIAKPYFLQDLERAVRTAIAHESRVEA